MKDFVEYEEFKSRDNTYSLLIYDIVDDKKRTKFAKYMESYGIRVQKSAFELRLNNKKLKQMIEGIDKYVSSEDSVKLYKIHNNDDVKCWGCAQNATNVDYVII